MNSDMKVKAVTSTMKVTPMGRPSASNARMSRRRGQDQRAEHAVGPELSARVAHQAQARRQVSQEASTVDSAATRAHLRCAERP